MRRIYGRLRVPTCLLEQRLLFILLLALLPGVAFAQGKIAGTVTDEQGEPLPGVNVVIDGTQQGTTTNVDGDYVIVNVRPGEYTLVFSFIGFQSRRVEGVRVVTGQTTEVDARLSESVIQGEEVVIRAERPLVQKDLTASRKTVNAEEIEQLPVESFFGVLATQAGVTQGAGGELHIRGGRSNEIAYLVDGMSVGNPFETNGLATGVAKDAIQEMTVISGAFNAEYGKAMSGIVNLVTKEGGQEYEGSFTAYGGDTFTSHDDIFMTPSGVDANTYTMEASLSGPLPILNNVRFFVSGRRNVDDGHIYGRREHLPSDRAVFNVTGDSRDALVAEIHRFLPDFDPEEEPISYYEMHGVPWYAIEADPALADSIAGVSELVSMNPSSSYNFLSKLTVRPFPEGKLQYSVLLDGSERADYDFDYRFNPDGQATIRENSFNHSLHWTHTLGERTFYTLKLSYAQSQYRYGVYENPFDQRYVADLSNTSGAGMVQGLPSNNFYFGGNEKTHIYEDAASWRGKFDFTRQFGVRHETKAGIDAQFHQLERENFEVLYDLDRYQRPTIENVNTAARDKYGCTQFFDVPEGVDYFYPQGTDDVDNPSIDCAPQQVLELAAYAQDKIEFDNFIINAGLRYERFDPNGTYVPDLLNLNEYVLVGEGVDEEDLLPMPEADVKHMFLPRLGVSFPITEQGIIHFSYGHFAQMPTLRNMYRNPEREFPANSVPTFGNPNMRPERTVQYEIGLQQQLMEQLAFNVTGYFKDIRDYLTLQRIRYSTIAGEDEYRIYQNKDYANIKGITFSLTKRRSRNGLLSATIDYTYQVAEGNNDDTDAFFFSFLSGRERELEIVPLDFDQRNILSGTVSLSRPGNWGLSFIGQYATGYPYSPVLYDQNLDLLPNSDRKPSLVQLDARLFKEFDLGAAQIRTFAQIYNVLDMVNERYVFDDTGRATYSLNVDNPHQAWQAYYGRPGIHTLDEWNTRPHWFSAPRSVRLGVTLAF